MAATTFPLVRRASGLASRRPSRRLIAALAAVAVAAVALFAVTRAGAGAGATGGVAPSFRLDDVRSPGMPVSLVPGRPTVVNFFAAWCIPCRHEVPLLEQAHRRAAGAVSFVGVDVDDSRTAAGDLLDTAGVSYPTGYDPDRAVAGRYRLQGMPTTVFIDGAGRVAAVVKGPLTAADLDRRLASLRGGS